MKGLIMSKLRSVCTSFWSDPFIEELKPSEKLLYLYLITNEKTNMLGIYELSTRKMSFETGILVKDIEAHLKQFEKLGKVKLIGTFVVICKYMKHQNYNTNMMKSAISIYEGLPDILKIPNTTLDYSNPLKAFETLSYHYGMVRKLEYEVEDESKDKKEEPFEEVLIKQYFENEEFHQPLFLWIQYKREKKQTYKPIGLNTLLKNIKRDYLTPKELMESIEHSMAGNYDGLFKKKNEQFNPAQQPIQKPILRPAHRD